MLGHLYFSEVPYSFAAIRWKSRLSSDLLSKRNYYAFRSLLHSSSAFLPGIYVPGLVDLSALDRSRREARTHLAVQRR